MLRTKSKLRALEILDGLTLPEPWDSRELVAQIANARGRRIRVHSVPTEALDDKACGLWVSAEDDDYLVYPDDCPAWYADLVICHELSHMLFEHDLEVIADSRQLPGERPIDLDGLASFLPDFDPAKVRAVLGRTVFGSRREDEAEYLATLIIDRVTGAAGDSRQARMLSTFLGAQAQ